MKPLVLILLFLMAWPLKASDFETAIRAYEDGNHAIAGQAFLRLAQQGDAPSQYFLGRLYWRGRGLLQDYLQAHKWFNLAAAGGHPHAATARDRLAIDMTQGQIAQAQQLARQWQPTTQQRAAPSIEQVADGALPSEGLVARVQLALRRHGVRLELDGQLDAITRAAIREYQMQYQLPIDGLPSDVLLAHIQNNESQPAIGLGSRPPEAVTDTRAWRRVLITDGFRDSDFERNPQWNVVQGRFWVDPIRGLRSTPIEPGESGSAEIYTPAEIPASFAIEVTLNANANAGRIEFGPYSGGQRAVGYRLYYTPGRDGSLMLVKLTGAQSGVLQQTRRNLDLSGDRSHSLRWTRDRRGVMVISLNDTEVLRFEDRAFAEGFEGFTIINRNGDFGVKHVKVKGTG